MSIFPYILLIGKTVLTNKSFSLDQTQVLCIAASMDCKPLPSKLTVEARPYGFTFSPRHTALLVIDMQRDFLVQGGFGEIEGGDLTEVRASIAPTKDLLDLCRAVGMEVFHTREGHRPDMSDCPASKTERQAAAPGTRYTKVIGDVGTPRMGRLLIRGEYGHDFVSELSPLRGETVVDKPGKGAFWKTDLLERLQARAITHLIVAGVTTECCFATTFREANDRGLECCECFLNDLTGVSDVRGGGIVEATAGYNSSFKSSSLDMLFWSQGLFGFVAHLESFANALLPYASSTIDACHDATPPQTPPIWDGDLSVDALRKAYRAGVSPLSVMAEVYDRIEAYEKKDFAVWIHLAPHQAVLAAARELLTRFPNIKDLPPLFGVPFSVKDSIDVGGIPTTTACPPLSTIPAASAVVVQKVLEQGAVFIGKVNLDQLATGLTGCRSPYGIPRSVFSKDHISGGSSSGSAVSVGANLVSFSLATDTAGSGRVPALFNSVVGFKPTRGTVSFEGVTPACLSLDCCAFTARTVEDARRIWQVCQGYDEKDRYAKSTPPTLHHIDSIGQKATTFNFGIPPPEALAVCSVKYHAMFNGAVQRLQALGGRLVKFDWSPFENAGKLLYNGTFVSERLASLPDGWFEGNREHLHPVIVEIFEQVVNRNSTAVQAYRDL